MIIIIIIIIIIITITIFEMDAYRFSICIIQIITILYKKCKYVTRKGDLCDLYFDYTTW